MTDRYIEFLLFDTLRAIKAPFNLINYIKVRFNVLIVNKLY